MFSPLIFHLHMLITYDKPSFSVSQSQVLLKLFSYCVKVKINRQQLVRPEMNTLNVMLGTLNLVSALVTARVNDAVTVILFVLFLNL